MPVLKRYDGDKWVVIEKPTLVQRLLVRRAMRGHCITKGCLCRA